MVTTFNNFIGGFFGMVVDFLMAEPIIYFVCMFLAVFCVLVLKQLINIKN